MRLLPAMPFLLLALLALSGCNRPNYETPVSAYRSFLQSVQRGDDKRAYAALSQPTQEILKARAQAAADASAGAMKADPVAFFFANVPPPADVTEVTLSSEEGDVAKVSVISSSGTSNQVRMVREPTGWKIDLTQSLQQP
jgi:nucleoid-associated protein YgaU